MREEDARKELRTLEELHSKLSHYVHQLQANLDLFSRQFSQQVRSRLESTAREHWGFYVTQWFTKYLALKDECLLLINGELLYKYQKAEHARFVRDRGRERKVYRENVSLSSCSIDGWNYLYRQFPRKISSKTEQRVEELSLQVEQLGSQIHELFRGQLKQDPLEMLGVFGRQYSIDDTDKAERLFHNERVVLERNTAKFKLNRHTVFAMVLEDDLVPQPSTNAADGPGQKRRRRLVDDEDDDSDNGNDGDHVAVIQLDEDLEFNGGEAPMELLGAPRDTGDYDVSISALKRDLGVDVEEMQAGHDQFLDEVGIAIQDEPTGLSHAATAMAEDDSTFFLRLETAWDAADHQQIIVDIRKRLARWDRREDSDRSMLLRTLGVALREVGRLSESKQALDAAVQSAIEAEDVLDEERAWTELGNTLLVIYEEQHRSDTLDNLASAYLKSLQLARRLATHMHADIATLPTSLYNFAHAQYLKNNLTEARTVLAEALAIGQQYAVGVSETSRALLHVLGLVWELMADVEAGDEAARLKDPAHCLAMAMAQFRQADNERDALRIRCCLADQLIQDDNFGKAIEVIDEIVTEEPTVETKHDGGDDELRLFRQSLLQLRGRAARLKTGTALWEPLCQATAPNSAAAWRSVVQEWTAEERDAAWALFTRQRMRQHGQQGRHEGSREAKLIDATAVQQFCEACVTLADAQTLPQWQSRQEALNSHSQQDASDQHASATIPTMDSTAVQLLQGFDAGSVGSSDGFWKRRRLALSTAGNQRPARHQRTPRTTIDRSAVPVNHQHRSKKVSKRQPALEPAQQQLAVARQGDSDHDRFVDEHFSLDTPVSGRVQIGVLVFVEGTAFSLPVTLCTQQDNFLEIRLLADEAMKLLWATQSKVVEITHLVASRQLACNLDANHPTKMSRESVLPLHAQLPTTDLVANMTDAGLYANTFDCKIDTSNQLVLDQYAQQCVQSGLTPDFRAVREITQHGRLLAVQLQPQPSAALCLATAAFSKLVELDFSFVRLMNVEALKEIFGASTSLHRLKLAHCGISSHMLQHACNEVARSSARLDQLDLSYNPLLTSQADHLTTTLRAVLFSFPALQDLNLNGIFVDPSQDETRCVPGTPLVAERHQESMRTTAHLRIQLQQIACTLETWEEIVAFLASICLTKLDFRGSVVEDEPHVQLWGLNAMQMLLTNSNISSLEFGDWSGMLGGPTTFSSATAATSSALIDNVAHPQCQLSHLGLRSADLPQAVAHQLFQGMLLYSNLQQVDLSFNNLGPDIFVAMESMHTNAILPTSNLCQLFLRRANLGFKGVCAVLALTQALPSLEILDVADNAQADGDEMAGVDSGVLVAATKRCCSQQQQLKVLDLSNNQLSARTRDQLALVCQPHFVQVVVFDPSWGLALTSSSDTSDLFCLARTSTNL